MECGPFQRTRADCKCGLVSFYVGIKKKKQKTTTHTQLFPDISARKELPAMQEFRSVQLLSYVRLFVTPWTEACQASLSITNYRSLLKLMSFEWVMQDHPGSIISLGSSPGEGISYTLQYSRASLVAQMVKSLPAMQETWV